MKIHLSRMRQQGGSSAYFDIYLQCLCQILYIIHIAARLAFTSSLVSYVYSGFRGVSEKLSCFTAQGT